MLLESLEKGIFATAPFTEKMGDEGYKHAGGRSISKFRAFLPGGLKALKARGFI